jgi:hypothetical protein
MKTLEYVVVSYWLDMASADQVHAWILHEIETNPEHDPALYQLLAHNHPDTAHTLETLLKTRNSTFHLHTPEGERILQEILQDQIVALLNRTTSPLLFCNFVQRLESLYLDTSPVVDGHIEYPHFLGDLWNACDWCDETWTLDNANYLQEEATNVLKALTASLQISRRV